jgi:tRNA(Ile)-lysidine synthase
MLEKIKKTIKTHNLINEGDGVVVALSGGPDSVALAHALCQLRKDMKIRICAVHLNHMFRGKDSDEDAIYVKDFCQKLNMPLFSFETNIEELAKDLKMSFEEAGRYERYRLFDKIKEEQGFEKIAIAQNQNDQCETVLMRMFRGTGLSGLTGTKYIRDDTYIRPLLDVCRFDIEAYCEEFKLGPRTDKTNLEDVYTRNKIRLRVIPYISDNFNPRFMDTFLNMVKLLSVDSDFIEKEAEKRIEELVKSDGGKLSIGVNDLNNNHEAIKTRIIRSMFLKTKGSLEGFTNKHIEEILGLLKSTDGSKKVEILGVTFIRRYDGLVVTNIEEKEKSLYLLEYDVYNVSEYDNIKRDCNSVLIDFEKVNGNLRYKFREDGDVFYPFGMKGKKKLKSFFIDNKVPKDERDFVPLICDDENIIWIYGYRISEKYKITEETKRVAVLKLERNKND